MVKRFRCPAWKLFDSQRRHIFSLKYFTLFPVFTDRCSPSKWNQAWPFTCRYCCIRPKIRLFIQGVCVYNVLTMYKRSIALSNQSPVETRAGIGPPYPHARRKRDIKTGLPSVSAWTGTLKNPTKYLWRLVSDRRSNFFSPPAHLCAGVVV